MKRPILVGISSYARDHADPPAFSLPCGYVDAIRMAGATPMVLPPGESDPGKLLDVVDAVVLAGGGDISPSAYGGKAHETVYMVSQERDQFEVDLARSALDRPDLPLLCICRGLQILNVALGGSLHAHLPDVFGESVLHRLPPRRPTTHPVEIDRGSGLAALLGTTRTDVCSWHHQAVDTVGNRLHPVARAADGVIEALELDDHRWCVAVQWHPEMQLEDATQQRLFHALVEAAKGSESLRDQTVGGGQR